MDAHADRHRRPARGELLQYLQVDLVGLAATPELLGVGEAEQPGGTQRREEPFGIGLGALVLLDARRQLLVGEVAGEREQVSGLLRGQHPVDGHGDSSRYCSAVLVQVREYR